MVTPGRGASGVTLQAGVKALVSECHSGALRITGEVEDEVGPNPLRQFGSGSRGLGPPGEPSAGSRFGDDELGVVEARYIVDEDVPDCRGLAGDHLVPPLLRVGCRVVGLIWGGQTTNVVV